MVEHATIARWQHLGGNQRVGYRDGIDPLTMAPMPVLAWERRRSLITSDQHVGQVGLKSLFVLSNVLEPGSGDIPPYRCRESVDCGNKIHQGPATLVDAMAWVTAYITHAQLWQRCPQQASSA